MIDKKEIYNKGGWIGQKFNSSLEVKDIAKIGKKSIMRKYKNLKISFKTKRYNTIEIFIKNKTDFTSEKLERIKTDIRKILNKYNFRDGNGVADDWEISFYIYIY
mgnify:CR=1 FL=1